MDTPEAAAWFRLAHTPGLSRRAARSLLKAFGSACTVFDATVAQWHSVAGQAASLALSEPDPIRDERWRQTQHWLGAAEDRWLLPLGHPNYPQPLLRSEDPPLLLYAEGALSALPSLQGPCLSIVGSRRATPQGLAHARTFAQGLGEAGLTIVSGLAVGIDAAAHEGALLGCGPTVAVVGTGLDTVYPRRHQALARRIAAQGVLLSEFAPGTPALPEHFPQRNRIIATLSEATLVVEAALQSGSLITARLAAEAGREVFAIPGSILAEQSRGCHALIRQGACLVESVDDVLAELRWPNQRPPPTGPTPVAAQAAEPDDPLLRALGHDPMTLDALSARTGMPAAALGARLLEFELEHLVARLPGGLFQRQGVS